MSAYRSSLFRSLKKEVSEKLPRWMTAILVLRVVRRVRIRSGEVRVGHRALNALPPWSLTFVSGYV